MKSVALHNLGCKVNGYETDYMQQMLQEKGYKIVSFDERADIYIVNTCTVTNIADRKSRQMLHRAKKQNPDAVVVAVGCYVQTGAEEALRDDGIDLAIGNNRKKDLIPILEEYLAEKEGRQTPEKTLGGATIIDINHTQEYESMQLKHTAEHTRAYIKIQDGCNQFCSYCMIPYARGRVRSRAQEEILSEVRSLAAAGYREVVLTGIHISSYGLDMDGISNVSAGEDFPHERLLSLILAIVELDGIERIRLGSLEPRIITPAFAEGLSRCSKFCPHFHLSLQSGCNSVLKRMNRKYTAEEYAGRVSLLRETFDAPAITTDVIVGFPQETEEEFRETEAFLQELSLYEMHVFKYSKRKGTAAAAMSGQLTEAQKGVRSDILLAMTKEQSKSYRQAHIGREAEILFEEEKVMGGRTYQVGYSKEYIRGAVLSEKPLNGQILRGTFTGMLDADVLLFQPLNFGDK